MTLRKEDLTAEEREVLAASAAEPTKFQLSQIQARRNAMVAIDAHPELAVTENLELICDWMEKNTLQHTVENFDVAYQALNAANLFVELEDAPAAPQKKVWTKHEIDSMSSDEFKRSLNDPEFAAQVESLAQTEVKRPRRHNQARQQFS